MSPGDLTLSLVSVVHGVLHHPPYLKQRKMAVKRFPLRDSNSSLVQEFSWALCSGSGEVAVSYISLWLVHVCGLVGGQPVEAGG